MTKTSIGSSSYENSTASSVLAKPSDFASFWASTTLLSSSLDMSLRAMLSKNPIFAALLEPVVGGAGFDFSTPRPDDRVFAARTVTQGVKSLSISSSKATTKGPSPTTAASSTSSTRSASPTRHTIGSSSISIKPTAAASPPFTSKAKKINVLEEYAKRNSEKSSLNLVIVGHVDAGKSTMMGHLLYLLGAVNERTMKKYERDAENMKKGSFCFAWVLDETEEERTRGVTIDVGISYFETKAHRFTILDAPGHRDFIPNMISGASQADVALLVIDSGTGEFEVGFELGGQTREHALLVRSLHVSQLVVAVNKLDTMDWAEHRFLEIKEKLTHFLTGAGFKKEKVSFVPCSGFTGENMVQRKSEVLSAWYSGPTLQESLDALTPPVRALEKPFRLPVVDYFKGGASTGGGGSLSVSGRVEAGTIQIGDTVTVMPLGEHGVVKSIEANNDPIKWAVAGDNIVVTLNGIDVQQALVPVADVFQVKIVTFDIAIPLTLGVPIVIHHQSAATSGIISKLNVTAVVEIKCERPICVELAKDSRELGRLMIRSGPTVVAAGIVTEIVNRVK
ncbi:UNVERIFIED_CONTAM: HBS1-like protein [Siphonaria sp. JEL0065]|nr:HBS1-like protein [Siphonaria sp. JEL0065]